MSAGHPGLPAGRWSDFNGYLRTTDGGTTWSCDTIPETENGMIWWIDALDANTAYVAVETWAASGMQGIYKTTDGGATWQKHPNNLYQLQITDLAISISLTPITV